MSHKVDVDVKIDNQEALIKALEEMGYEAHVEKKRLSAYGWSIDADITIKKKESGRQPNIGFIKQEDGTFKMEADFFLSGINETDFRNELNILHGKHKVSDWLVKHRYNTSYEKDEEGNMVVLGTRWI